MNENLLNYARLELTQALRDTSGSTKGQLQAFAEYPPADKERNPRKPLHVIELEDGEGGIRRVKAENTALYVLETRSRRSPLPPINDDEFAAAPWRRAVNTLPEHEQAWLRYCYGFDLTFRYQTLICEAIWKGHQKHLPAGLLKKTRKRLISLVWLAVQEVATGCMNDTYKAYAGALLASQLGVSRSTWCEIYGQHWQRLKQSVVELDQNALGKVINRMSDRAFKEVTA
ncbi:bacteriophage antitermination protein Q [Erwinia pyrifoliae]|uniref:bacteriophage antitermination protein Q n=1 Tax=Erwinia pyrifoliae TaxID=79967 RepID=UPI00223B474F|nr:bacteriophage antitermination protein Q [Erwinia pyrifoliae]MCT2387131.1 bacteriophage antitermination protein Q [Erwinia pyrifoliae]MCU8587269.1 bacteriophage antitermination protein Q [Erwinia pyrifoliae]